MTKAFTVLSWSCFRISDCRRGGTLYSYYICKQAPHHFWEFEYRKAFLPFSIKVDCVDVHISQFFCSIRSRFLWIVSAQNISVLELTFTSISFRFTAIFNLLRYQNTNLIIKLYAEANFLILEAMLIKFVNY